jgi:hypothetical protein
MTLPAAIAAKKDNQHNGFNNPIELPSMQIADAADRAQEEAYNSLEFVKKNKFVRCQCCHKPIKIVGKMHRPTNDRIVQIKKRIKSIEEYNLKYNNKATSDSGINELKQELAELLKEEEKRDRLRSLPLYSSKITNYRFFCSPCWDKAYLLDQERRKKERMNQ